MATLTITIPDAQLTRVQTALCVPKGVPVTGPNAKDAVISLMKSAVFGYERGLDEVDARAAYDAAIQPGPDPGLT